jgi:hypothetical protein
VEVATAAAPAGGDEIRATSSYARVMENKDVKKRWTRSQSQLNRTIRA